MSYRQNSYIPACPYPSNEPTMMRKKDFDFVAVRNILKKQRERHEQLADQYRTRTQTQSTAHARKLAQRMRLSLDIVRAVQCPQTHVSVEPLPILDTSILPGSSPVRAASEEIYPILAPIVIPAHNNIQRWATQASIHGSPPKDIPVEETPSWFDDLDFDDDMSSSSSSGESQSDCYSTSSSASSMLPMYTDNSALYVTSAKSNYGEILTPDSSSLMIRIKRKSMLMEDQTTEFATKQPRYERKSWVRHL